MWALYMSTHNIIMFSRVRQKKKQQQEIVYLDLWLWRVQLTFI